MSKRSLHSEATAVAASRGARTRAALRIAKQLFPQGASVPLTVSLVAHAGLVMVAVRQVHAVVAVHPALAATELPAPDLVNLDEGVPELPISAQTTPRVRDAAPRAALARAAFREST